MDSDCICKNLLHYLLLVVFHLKKNSLKCFSICWLIYVVSLGPLSSTHCHCKQQNSNTASQAVEEHAPKQPLPVEKTTLDCGSRKIYFFTVRKDVRVCTASCISVVPFTGMRHPPTPPPPPPTSHTSTQNDEFADDFSLNS